MQILEDFDEDVPYFILFGLLLTPTVVLGKLFSDRLAKFTLRHHGVFRLASKINLDTIGFHLFMICFRMMFYILLLMVITASLVYPSCVLFFPWFSNLMEGNTSERFIMSQVAVTIGGLVTISSIIGQDSIVRKSMFATAILSIYAFILFLFVGLTTPVAYEIQQSTCGERHNITDYCISFIQCSLSDICDCYYDSTLFPCKTIL